jgi:beta-phosphoglucomutase
MFDWEVVLFDLDGVLWNSNNIHRSSYERVCEIFEMSCPDYTELAGLSTYAGVKYIATRNNSNLSREKIELFVNLKRRFASELLIESTGAELTLWDNFEIFDNCQLALITGAGQNTVEIYLSKLGFNPFGLILTGDDFEPKPSPAGYLKAIQHFKKNKDTSLIFEDSLHGIQSAENAEVSYVHIYHSWGKCELPHLKSRNKGCFRDIKEWHDFTKEYGL